MINRPSSGIHGITSALANRDARRQSVVDLGGGHFAVYGEIELANIGKTDFDVKFPIGFIVRPFISCSGFLAEGETYAAADEPSYDISGLSLTYEEKPGGSRVYTGARLVVLARGREGVRSYVTWKAEGRALTNPARPTVGIHI